MATRSINEINNDYFQTAAILGDLVWKVAKFTGEDTNGAGQIKECMRKLKAIDVEMDKLQAEKTKQDKINADLAAKRIATEKKAKTNGAEVPDKTEEGVAIGLQS